MVFPGDHPSNYSTHPKELNFGTSPNELAIPPVSYHALQIYVLYNDLLFL